MTCQVISNNQYRKRVNLSASKGSVTLEAAISITLFMLLTLYFVSYMTMMGTVFERQIFLDSTVKKISKAAFYLEFVDHLTEHNQELKEQNEKFRKIASDIEAKGISLTDAFYQDGMIDIKLNYCLETFYWNHQIPISQRARMRDWRGIDIQENQDIVYITKTGTVYHCNRNCRYLNIQEKPVELDSVTLLRNRYGAKYSPCEICAKNNPLWDSKVYITTDGKRYHTDINCSGLTRYVISIQKKDVGERNPCSVCGG